MPKYRREEEMIDRLERENRELKAANKTLLRRLKKVSRGYYKFLDSEEEQKDSALEDVKKEVKKICFQCGVGEYKEVIVHNRRWRQCQNCGKRGKVTIIDTQHEKAGS